MRSGEVEELLKESKIKCSDFVSGGIHFGRGEAYYSEITSTQLKHKTTGVKRWRIVNESLEQIEEKFINKFYSSETYIIEWKSVTDTFRFNTDDVLNKHENVIYFYWKGEDAAKGYSPLPETIEKDNPPVERIVQWAEPPAFLHLFSGCFIVHFGKHNASNDESHLYILRGEMEKEIHFYEVPLKKENLRSRTSFVLHFPKENSVIVWHGNQSSAHCRSSSRKSAEKVFGLNIAEVEEGSEGDTFLNAFAGDESEYFGAPSSKIINYTPRLFYFNQITGSFSVTEIEHSHKSLYTTPFPFLQSHLYTADQPAIFLFDDNDEIWIWYGWQREENDDFKAECFTTAINYAKEKSKSIESLVKVHKVLAGFEPNTFTNLFPLWKKRKDIAEIQEKGGVLPSTNALIEVISHEEVPNSYS